MSDTVEEAFARLSAATEVVDYRCLECDESFDSGREMRDHAGETGHPVQRVRA